jgi:hypothetical protein
VVECDLAKVEVAGSNPVSRSRFRFVPEFINHKGLEVHKGLKSAPFPAKTWAFAENQVT